MAKTEKDQSKKNHPTEEQANTEESKRRGEDESTGYGTDLSKEEISKKKHKNKNK